MRWRLTSAFLLAGSALGRAEAAAYEQLTSHVACSSKDAGLGYVASAEECGEAVARAGGSGFFFLRLDEAGGHCYLRSDANDCPPGLTASRLEEYRIKPIAATPPAAGAGERVATPPSARSEQTPAVSTTAAPNAETLTLSDAGAGEAQMDQPTEQPAALDEESDSSKQWSLPLFAVVPGAVAVLGLLAMHVKKVMTPGATPPPLLDGDTELGGSELPDPQPAWLSTLRPGLPAGAARELASPGFRQL
eukprot:TRINITY_DN23951_c0_g1_i1.p1 TRINITY_DN23951_c0_g1~~TRINITY_DN23951_c0_g1_i1.p1  ORF type:complete len:248 (+),score=50.64 TRINITY_DN23951_c0_g1_i1:79-822(+)